MPESDQHLEDDDDVVDGVIGNHHPKSPSFSVDMGDVQLSDDMSFDAIAAEIRRTMSQSGSVLGNLIEQKEKSMT